MVHQKLRFVIVSDFCVIVFDCMSQCFVFVFIFFYCFYLLQLFLCSSPTAKKANKWLSGAARRRRVPALRQPIQAA